MSTAFKTYNEAYNAAVRLARQRRDAGHPLDQCEIGLEYNKIFKEYSIKYLPKPENRYGWEQRCEVIRPGDPLTEKVAS